jgi:hypothetical protein
MKVKRLLGAARSYQKRLACPAYQRTPPSFLIAPSECPCPDLRIALRVERSLPFAGLLRGHGRLIVE